MKKILVLGGNGFIGQNLCNLLLEKNEDVYSFDMSLPKQPKEGIHYLDGDFFDDYTLEHIVKDMDVIYHAICTLNPGNSNEKCILGYERDFVQTAKLCSLIKDTDTKMIFLSSGGTVYGNQKVQPITEDAVPVPINHYGNLKLCIENTIRTFNFQSKKNMLVARISNPYGPGQDYLKGVGFIDAALKHSVKDEPIEIWGDGTVVRDYIYIDDLCNMLYTLMNYDGTETVFNLSSGVGCSQNEILDVVKVLYPNVDIKYLPGRKVDAKKIILDNSKICELGVDIETSIKVGIQKYYNYILDTLKERE